MTNQPSSAVDELRAVGYFIEYDENRGGWCYRRNGAIVTMINLCDDQPLVPFESAKRIIAAQEQRLGELERDADYKSTLHDLVTERDALQAKVEQQEQQIGELEAQHAAWLIERAELRALATGLEAERDHYRAALARVT